VLSHVLSDNHYESITLVQVVHIEPVSGASRTILRVLLLFYFLRLTVFYAVFKTAFYDLNIIIIIKKEK